MAQSPEPILLADGLVPAVLLRRGERKVDHRAAALANKVVVQRGIGVETLLSLYHAHALDNTLLPEQGQVTVDRTQTQIRMGGLQLLLDPLSGRV